MIFNLRFKVSRGVTDVHPPRAVKQAFLRPNIPSQNWSYLRSTVLKSRPDIDEGFSYVSRSLFLRNWPLKSAVFFRKFTIFVSHIIYTLRPIKTGDAYSIDLCSCFFSVYNATHSSHSFLHVLLWWSFLSRTSFGVLLFLATFFTDILWITFSRPVDHLLNYNTENLKREWVKKV